MKLSIAIVLLLAATASAEPQLAGNVLVWVDAPLYLDANAGGTSIRIAALDRGRDQDVGYVFPMHVVGVHGDFLEVEPTDDIECAWWRIVRPDGLASLRLFVQRSDLAPVVTKAFAATFKDGSRIAVQPGTAVLDGKVAFHDGVVPAAIPTASQGVAYAPHAITPVPPRGKRTFLLDEKTDVTLGKDTFSFGPWVASSAEQRGKRMLVQLTARCMTATVSAPKEHVHAGVALGKSMAQAPGGAAAKAGSGGDRYYFAQGTPLTSQTGDHVVATLTEDRDIKKPSGPRGCADFVVAREEAIVDAPHTLDSAQPSRTLHLCAPAAAVKVERR